MSNDHRLRRDVLIMGAGVLAGLAMPELLCEIEAEAVKG